MELDNSKIEKIKEFIFRNGRLLERTLFSYFFEKGSKNSCLKALTAYQNDDGGFGNGIEPDLLCPDSTAIGAETAFFILDVLGEHNHDIISKVIEWIRININANGYINHPLDKILNYPYQPWWKNPDDLRILSLLGYLQKWNKNNNDILKKGMIYFSNTQYPEKMTFYGYPYLLFLKYCSSKPDHKILLSEGIKKLPTLIEENQTNYPLFGRAWYHFIEDLEPEIVNTERDRFIQSIQDDGGIISTYPELPWWRSISTLDGLIILKSLNN